MRAEQKLMESATFGAMFPSGCAHRYFVQTRHPACVICVPLPSSSSIVGGDHRKEIRFLPRCQIRVLAVDLKSNFKKNATRHYHQHSRTFAGEKAECHVWRNSGLQVKTSQTSDECSSVGERVSRALRWKLVKPTSIRAAGETQDEVGRVSMPAMGNAAWRTVSVHVLGALLMGSLLFGVSSAEAADVLKTCSCLLKECRVELARCIADPGCAANVACLQTCNNRPDETECQIACGDLFENKVVDQFNDCAVSRKGCVPQKKDEGLFPVPPPPTLVQKFDPQDFTGTWYITSGFNKTFDTFACQVHEFSATPNTITGKLSWRIPTPDGGFITRSGVQNFVQDTNQPGVLYNHGNEFLHYQDDWYVLSAKTDKSPDDYIFIYYRGSNDAWDGYGGAVVYTRSRTLPPSIIPELTQAAKRAGLDFKKFTTTDNSCGPAPPLFARLEKKVEDEEKFIVEEVKEEEQFLVKGVKEVVNRVGKAFADIVNGETNLLKKGAEELQKDEERFLKSLGDEERALLNELNMEAKDIEKLFGNAIPIRKIR